MTPVPATPSSTRQLENLELEVRRLIDSLAYLPTSAAVALKFVELGKNLEADPNDYAQVVSSDSSLSSKILSMANSSWAGVRNKVTSVRVAVNLLGLGTVRTLAVSYCMTGLHNELRLSPEESRLFWEAPLSKAIAAKLWAGKIDPKKADESFAGGLFQDFALTLMYAAARQEYLSILQDPKSNRRALLEKERAMFGMDHAEVGRLLAQKLQLPDFFVDVIAFHHDREKLCGTLESDAVAGALYAASTFPHVAGVWHPEDIEDLRTFVGKSATSYDIDGYLNDVQTEFAKIFELFHEGGQPSMDLSTLLVFLSRDVADNTEEMVRAVNQRLHEATESGSPGAPTIQLQ